MYNLYSCVWEITLACCFECRYCGSGAGKARTNELSLEECISVAQQLYELNCRRVSLIGGEVFMRKDWREIVDALTSRGIKVNIITNGFSFSEKYVSDLKNLNIESVSVSIDGVRDMHDKFRQTGSYDRAIAAIRALSLGGIPVSVISTVHSENADSLSELYEELAKENIWAWQLQACSPMGNARNLDYRFDFSKVISFVEANKNSAPFVMGIADNIGYFTDEEDEIRGTSGAIFGGCSAGISTIGIDSVGNIRGCESMYDQSFIEGNIRERSIKDIWEDKNAFSYNRQYKRKLLAGKCKSCKAAKKCRGGCRSYNYFVKGNMYESPFCARVQ